MHLNRLKNFNQIANFNQGESIEWLPHSNSCPVAINLKHVTPTPVLKKKDRKEKGRGGGRLHLQEFLRELDECTVMLACCGSLAP